VLAGHFLVDLEPPRAGLDGDRGDAAPARGTAVRDERVVHLDPAHLAGATAECTTRDSNLIACAAAAGRRGFVHEVGHCGSIGAAEGARFVSQHHQHGRHLGDADRAAAAARAIMAGLAVRVSQVRGPWDGRSTTAGARAGDPFTGSLEAAHLLVILGCILVLGRQRQRGSRLRLRLGY
jgi:hypothetical protein